MIRAAPIHQLRPTKTDPKAMADAMPEQNTNISVASENPNRAGIHRVSQLPGVCAMRMMNITIPDRTALNPVAIGSAFVIVEAANAASATGGVIADAMAK